MPKKTPEEKAALMLLSRTKFKIRLLLVAGKTDEALALAEKSGISVFSARLAPEYRNDAEPAFRALEQAAAQTANAPLEAPAAAQTNIVGPDLSGAASSAELENGWPKRTPAVVWGLPPNKRMVTIQLPDGRKTGMWKARNRTYRIHGRLNAKLVSAQADAIYEEDFA